MTIEEELQKYILDKYKSVMQFSKIAEIPYTTVKGIFTRGIWGASVQNVTKICDILEIDINELIKGNIKSQSKSHYLSEHEHKLIKSYRQQPSMQETVDRLLGIEEEHIKEKHA